MIDCNSINYMSQTYNSVGKRINWQKTHHTAARVNYDFEVEVVKGDITDEKVNAIVNPANENLDHGGGCAAAIQSAAGHILMAES